MEARGGLMILLIGFLKLICSAPSDPSPLMLNSAYCACKCCDDEPDLCYMHPAIRGMECDPTQCTKEFCSHWLKAKCKTSCYCRKCKHELPKGSYKCARSRGIPDGCHCPDMDTIKCHKEVEEMDSTPEMDEAMKNVAQYKENLDCMVPCFCSKCKTKIPEDLESDCNRLRPPKKACDCSNVTCPSTKELERFREIMQESQELEQKATSDAFKAHAEKLRKDTEKLNEKLKPEIEAGKVKPLKAAELKSTKCRLQCLCDKCRHESTQMDRTCDNLLKEREDFCPKCPQDLTCPPPEAEATCRLFCFCDVCKYDKRMPEFLRSHCDHVDVKDTSSCQCSDIPIDCNDLDKITPSQREAMKKFHSESSSPPSSTKRKEDSSKPGKIKQKNKMWDEL